MSFLYPLGLLGLIAIPVLILVYILKNKHTEVVVTSTYLWTLSERFLKRRNPISRLTGIISLILQILAVACISLAIAHPVITLKGAADDYVFILDASGSMHFVEDSRPRFDVGKEKIREIIEDSANGSSYTLICAGETTGVVYEETEDREYALSALDSTEGSASATTLYQANGLAKEYFAKKPSSKIYLVTDKTYESLENVELIDVSAHLENYAVSDVEQRLEKGELLVAGNVISYESATTLTVTMTVKTAGDPVTATQEIQVEAGVATPFTFNAGSVNYQSISVKIEDTDALLLDNETILYNVTNVGQGVEGGVLVISANPIFLENVISAVLGTTVGTVEPEIYLDNPDAYGKKQLYVFDDCVPEQEKLPKDGAVWFINPTSAPANAGFSVQGGTGEEGLSQPLTLRYSDSTSTHVTTLLRDVLKEENIYVDQYVKCGFYRTFHTLLALEGNPMIFAGTNGYDNRTVVFAFPLSRSDIVLKYNFTVLVRNLLGYIFPSIVSQSSYQCGESASINVLTNCDSIRIDTPSGNIVYLDAGTDITEYTLSEVGTYKITELVDEVPHVVYIYGNLAKEERVSTSKESTFAVEGTPSDDRRDGRYDDLLILFIILAAIFLADWVVYSYEQHKLR